MVSCYIIAAIHHFHTVIECGEDLSSCLKLLPHVMLIRLIVKSNNLLYIIAADNVGFVVAQTAYTVTEGVNPLVTVCAEPNIELQRDGVAVSFGTIGGSAVGMFIQ